VRVVERNGDRRIPRSDWQLVDAGPVRWKWTDVAPITSAVGRVIIVEARSPLGTAEASLAFVPGAE
jgi:hypothetical protein